jgi:hypothetical protein
MLTQGPSNIGMPPQGMPQGQYPQQYPPQQAGYPGVPGYGMM